MPGAQEIIGSGVFGALSMALLWIIWLIVRTLISNYKSTGNPRQDHIAKSIQADMDTLSRKYDNLERRYVLLEDEVKSLRRTVLGNGRTTG